MCEQYWQSINAKYKNNDRNVAAETITAYRPLSIHVKGIVLFSMHVLDHRWERQFTANIGSLLRTFFKPFFTFIAVKVPAMAIKVASLL